MPKNKHKQSYSEVASATLQQQNKITKSVVSPVEVRDWAGNNRERLSDHVEESDEYGGIYLQSQK